MREGCSSPSPDHEAFQVPVKDAVVTVATGVAGTVPAVVAVGVVVCSTEGVLVQPAASTRMQARPARMHTMVWFMKKVSALYFGTATDKPSEMLSAGARPGGRGTATGEE
jgi:hypothetical protein